MTDGIYTYFGRRPLPEEGEGASPAAPGWKKVLAFWGALALGIALLGMTIGGLCKRRGKRGKES